MGSNQPLTIQIDMKNAIKKIEAINKNVIPELQKALEQGTMVVLATAKELAPVDTSLLRTSIHRIKMSDNEYVIEDGVDYGVYQEYGTSKMQAQPFFRPAVMRHEGTIRSLCDQAIARALKS